ncbi:MAG: phage baseplate assembly protein V [Bacteroidota bacterium]
MPDTIIPVSVSIANFKDDVIYRNLVVNTVVGGHHQFSFTWNVGNLKNDQAFQVKTIKDNIGSLVSIQFDKNEFTGIITSIAVEDINSATQAFVVSGQSLSILIDDVPQCASYYKKNLKKIITGTLDGVPDNVLKKNITPTNTDEHQYITQYNETDFQFLQRLSTRYGEWFYVDGQKLVFGKTGNSGAELKAGSDVKNFVIQGNLQPAKYSFKAYDGFKGENINKDGSPLDSLSNDYGDAAIGASKDVYSRSTGRAMHSFNAVNKEMIESIAKLQTSVKTTQSLTVRGESKNPAMKAGNKFKIKTESGSYEYIATSVVHHSSQRGHYENNFNAVAGSSKVPPYTNPNVFRRADSQSALVKENHDTDGLNRIKVQFPWQKSSDMSPWIRVTTPHAGGDKGWHFIPEKSEEVLVDFEGGDVDKPYMVASHFHGAAKSGLGDADNNVKSLITKSGNTFTLNDKDGSITITDPKGSTIILKGDETIEIKSKSKITVSSKDLEFKADNDIKMSAGNNFELESGNKFNMKSSSDMSIESQTKITQQATTDFTVSGMKVDLDAQTDFKVHGLKVDIKADTEFAAEGSIKASLKGGAQLEMSGGAMATMKGGIVMIN